MTTAAETYLSDSDSKISLVRDYLIAVCAALSSAPPLSERESAAIYRLADVALDEITSLERDFDQAFHETFSGGNQLR